MPHLLLVGAGHAHLHLLAHADDLLAAGYRVTVLAPATFDYSGVASATAAGDLPAATGRIDVRALTTRHGVTLVEDTMVGLDVEHRTATTSGGDEIAYDVVSLNLGSVAGTHGIDLDEGVVRVKPLAALADLAARLDEHRHATITVVGGGASGLELAAHLSVRPGVAHVRLLEAGPTVGADLPHGARRRLVRLLGDRGVEISTGVAVSVLTRDRVTLDDDQHLDHDVALLATGLVAPPLLAELGLGDAAGVPVAATLQHVDHPEIYAVGDCARFTPHPLPRIGVHGVRQGPVVLASLLARARHEVLPTYEPQDVALSVLDLGDGVGLAVRGRWWWYGAPALRLKRFIDRRWLRQYR